MPEFDETPVGDPSAKCPTPEVVVPQPKHVFLAGQTFEAKTSPESTSSSPRPARRSRATSSASALRARPSWSPTRAAPRASP